MMYFMFRWFGSCTGTCAVGTNYHQVLFSGLMWGGGGRVWFKISWVGTGATLYQSSQLRTDV